MLLPDKPAADESLHWVYRSFDRYPVLAMWLPHSWFGKYWCMLEDGVHETPRSAAKRGYRYLGPCERPAKPGSSDEDKAVAAFKDMVRSAPGEDKAEALRTFGWEALPAAAAEIRQ